MNWSLGDIFAASVIAVAIACFAGGIIGRAIGVARGITPNM